MVQHPFLTIGVRAARRAGDIIIRSLPRLDSLEVTEKARNEFATEVDQQAEADIIETVRRNYPDHAFLAEESGRTGESDYTWIIDPLDGTTNYIHGFPQFAVSIAVMHRDQLEAAVVYDPMRQELFTAARGAGAQLDGRRIRVTQRRSLDGALIGTGIPFRGRLKDLDRFLNMLRKVVETTAGVRRPGAASLDLAYLAAGRLDGFGEAGLKPWDVAAGALLIREAGGIVSNLAGEESWLESGNICAGAPRVHKALLELLHPTLDEGLRR